MISLIRKYEYKELSKVTLDGNILDLGGSRKSGYHNLLKGSHHIEVVNFDEKYGFDINFDLEKKFPLNDNSYDHLMAINVLEHIYDYNSFLAESFRILKANGKFILTSPFLFQIHGCPNDYNRFTKDALIKMFENHHFQVEKIIPLGKGIFSVIYQLAIGGIPTKALKIIIQTIFVWLDKMLAKVCPSYKKLISNYPLGYFIVLKK